jgi:hypothetical protein
MSIEDRLRTGLAANADPLPPAIEDHLDTVRRRYRARIWARAATAAAVVVVLAAAGWWATTALLGDRGVSPAEPTIPGTYVVVVQGSGPTAVLTGTWEVTLGSDGAISYTPPAASGLPAGTGESYVLDDDELRTNALVGFPGCQRTNPATGSYAVVADGDTLTFRVVSDGCPARRALFGTEWERRS